MRHLPGKRHSGATKSTFSIPDRPRQWPNRGANHQFWDSTLGLNLELSEIELGGSSFPIDGQIKAHIERGFQRKGQICIQLEPDRLSIRTQIKCGFGIDREAIIETDVDATVGHRKLQRIRAYADGRQPIHTQIIKKS